MTISWQYSICHGSKTPISAGHMTSGMSRAALRLKHFSDSSGDNSTKDEISYKEDLRARAKPV
jgi:hypothetical protein